MDAPFKRIIDEELIAQIVDGLNDHMVRLRAIGIDKAYIGISGGVDSAVACALLQRSDYPVRAIVIEMDDPDGPTPMTDFALQIAAQLKVEHHLINAADLYREHLKLHEENSVMARVHLRSRVINNIILQFADDDSAIVIDTTDRSEDILKIYEESFRGHVAPLIGLYKSEIYDLADHFSLSGLRQTRSGCPELLDFDAFGMEWEDLDALSYLMVEQKAPIAELAERFSLDRPWLQALSNRIANQPLRTDVERIRPHPRR